MDKVFCRSAYNYDMTAASIEAGLQCHDKSLTKQSFAEEVDINTIVKRFNLTGELPSGVRVPEYADFEGVFDYHSALNAIAAAHESFDAMPAQVRARFNNEPGAFVDFCNDPDNLDEMVKLGLAVKLDQKESDVPAAPAAGDGKSDSAAAAQAAEADGKGA